MAVNCARFQTTTDEDHWFDLLASVMTGLGRIYVVIDTGILSNVLVGGKSLPEAFLHLFSKLADRRSKTQVKVLLISYISPRFAEIEQNDIRDLVLQVRAKAARVRQRRVGFA